jgi:hypothetical protein
MANQGKDEGASQEPSPEPLKWAAIPETAPEVAMSPDVDEQTREPAIIAPLRLTAPGIYGDVAEHDYHADPCPEPSLSRTVLKRLVDLSPRHAWAIHPRLGGMALSEDSNDEVSDAGTAAHASFLQGRSTIVALDFPDWRTNKAKAARAEVYADGLIPLLTKGYGHAMRMIDVLEDFRSRTGAFTKGQPEQTVIWREDTGIWCRARVDWLPDEPSAAPWDLKTTAGLATLPVWSRAAFDKAADIQDVFYCRGLEMVRGEPPERMRFAVIEQKPPFGIKVFSMAPQTREAADDDVRLGIRMWGDCLASRDWPTYSIEEEWVYPPAWISRAREERGAERKRLEQIAWSKESPLAVAMVESGDFGG